MPLTIAALVPVSRMFAGADLTFVAGLRGALAESGVAHTLHVEPIGACNVKDLVVDKVQRVLLQHAPDVVTGVMGAGMLRHVDGFFRDAATPFLVTDLGADPLMLGAGPNPYVFSNAMNLWQSMHALGFWAARNVGTRAATAAALHEGGYGILPAFWLGFQAGGGTMIGIEITHRQTADDDPSEQLRRLASIEPEFIFGLYAGREGISFVNAYHDLRLAGRIPLISTPLTAHAQWRPRMAGREIGIPTAWSWDMTSRPGAHAAFAHAAKITPGKQPAVFALLGYEAGLFMAAAARETGAPMVEALSRAVCDSPRGDLRFDPVTREVATRDYLAEPAAEGGLLTRAPLDLAPSFADDYARTQNQDRSGWINPYLIT